MKKYVVYEAVIGEYDQILQPIVLDENFDYILFSDTITAPKVGVWQVRSLPAIDGSNKLKSGFAKCHIEELLGDYEASLWIDGNIQISSKYVYSRFMELLESSVEWASIKHPSQQCTYDEICAIVELRWVLDSQIVDWYVRLKQKGFPAEWGLYETNVLYRRHNRCIYDVCKKWWETLAMGVKRDQFSVMYALWLERPKMAYYLPNGECPRLGSLHFNYALHNPHKRIQSLDFHEMMRYRLIRTKYPSNVRKGYHDMFEWVCTLSIYLSMVSPKTLLFVWEIFFGFMRMPKLLYNIIKNRLNLYD